MENYDDLPLFETRSSRRRLLFQTYVASVSVAMCLILLYRVSYFPIGIGTSRWIWIGMFLSELWFVFYWFIGQVIRWNPLYYFAYMDRLSQRYEEKDLPGIDIFVCTADPEIEPPAMVICTVLSVMAYNYPPEKLSVYLSDDGGSDLTFYAMLEASRFAKHWLPFCKRFNKVEPRSPEAYFRTAVEPPPGPQDSNEWLSVKNLYEQMKDRIEDTTRMGQVLEDVRREHKGFLEWNFVSSKHDHQTIVQILIDGRDPNAIDNEGHSLPTLVYLAREKRPQCHHNFKAGAMNSLIRVSSRISNAPIILNVDCDMYSNNSDTIRYSLCFFMDEDKGHDIAYIQYPQNFENLTKNDIYASSHRVTQALEFKGLNDSGGPCYIGSGCFHRRDALCGKKYIQECKIDWKKLTNKRAEESIEVLERECKVLASCTYEEGTQWGKEMGLTYGFPVEDVITGLSIQCRGWKSVSFEPERAGFLGLAPITLLQSLVQHKRWSEGHFQIFLSSRCPLLYGHKRIPLQLQLSYCRYSLWAPNCLAALYYITVPSLCLLGRLPLFPQVSSIWIQPFVYAVTVSCIYDLVEFLWCGGTLKEWWNEQRMRVFKRSTSYLFGFMDNILIVIGLAKSGFVITAKVAREDASLRYEQEVMEFGVASPMFSILTTLALLNLFSSLGGIAAIVLKHDWIEMLNAYAVQILLSGVLVIVNLPLYQGLFLRKDNGKMPMTVTYQSIIIAIFTCSIIIAIK